MLPEVGGVILERILSNVDFPAPFLPMIPNDSPGYRICGCCLSSAQNSSMEFIREENEFADPVTQTQVTLSFMVYSKALRNVLNLN